MEHFITLSDYPVEILDRIVETAEEIKNRKLRVSLNDRSIILVFFNPSLRTRTSFELAMKQLGGSVVTLNAGGDTWKLETGEGVVMDGDRPEHVKDAARVLGRYADAIGARAFAEGKNWEEDRKDPIINAFVQHSGVPVINMESSLYHPNQALADIMTMKEKFGQNIKGLPVTITWAYHPKPLPMAVPNSILLACSMYGMDVRLVRPPGYDLDQMIMQKARALSGEAGGSILVTDNIEQAFQNSSVVYAKSWGSLRYYGDGEGEKNYRRKFTNWIVDEGKMSLTSNGYFMHCLPVRRGVVVEDSVIDGKNSIVYDEAENRLHAQKAVLYHKLGV
ncbi:MAG: N-acetylornithine carbamoyltransferase [Spirochaetota bacterium]